MSKRKEVVIKGFKKASHHRELFSFSHLAVSTAWGFELPLQLQFHGVLDNCEASVGYDEQTFSEEGNFFELFLNNSKKQTALSV